MKRGNKAVLGIISVSVALCMGVSLAACSTSSHEHTWGDWETQVEATCTTGGLEARTCSGCGQQQTQATEALGHDWETVESTATCTSAGYVKVVCSRCGALDEENSGLVQAIGHTPDEDIAPEYGDNGSVILTCIDCGQKYVADQVDSSDDSWLDTGDTEEGVTTYEVSNASQLANLADYVNEEGNDMEDCVIELTSDIDLGGAEWTPIGAATLSDDGYIDTTEGSDAEYAFSGTFDGNGYTISNLRVDTESCAGLFGYLKDGTVKNVTIDGATIHGSQGVGIIAGDCDDNTDRSTLDTITNVRVTGLVQITGSHFVGGIAGRIESTDIENCSIEADAGSYIKGIYEKEDYEGDAIGGIVGYMGIKEGTDSSTGNNYETSEGVDNASHVYDVLVSGLDISGSRKVGGIAGNAYTNDENYAFISSASYVASTEDDTEDNTPATAAATDAIVGNTVKDCTISITEVTEDDYTSSLMGKSRLFVGAILGELTTASTTIKKGTITSCEVSGVTVEYLDDACVHGLTDGDTTYKGFYGGSRSGYTVTFVECTGSVKCVGPSGESDNSWLDTKGTDTVDGQTVDTYEVSTAAQLVNFAEYVNGSAEDADMSSTEIKLTSDIDLTGVDWTPIGDFYSDDGTDQYAESEAAFCGTFDGQNHTISNLNVETDNEYAGLFGYIYDATIKNVTIENATVTGVQDVGALVGSSGDTLDTVQEIISNCKVTGLVQITGNHFVGGLIGRAEATDVENCSVEADEGSYVKGVYAADEENDNNDGDAVGGLIGFMMNYKEGSGTDSNRKVSIIKDVSVSGLDISGTRKVGGLVGNLCDNNNTSLTDKSEIITATEGSYNTVSDCTISITIIEDVTAELATKASGPFVGAIVGEFTGYSTKIDCCVVENVTVNYYSAGASVSGSEISYVFQGTTDEDTGETLYAGFYGGSRSGSAVEVTLGSNCSGSATLVYIGPVAEDTATD